MRYLVVVTLNLATLCEIVLDTGRSKYFFEIPCFRFHFELTDRWRMRMSKVPKFQLCFLGTLSFRRVQFHQRHHRCSSMCTLERQLTSRKHSYDCFALLLAKTIAKSNCFMASVRVQNCIESQKNHSERNYSNSTQPLQMLVEKICFVDNVRMGLYPKPSLFNFTNSDDKLCTNRVQLLYRSVIVLVWIKYLTPGRKN